MLNFLVNKTQSFVDRPHEFGQLMKYIAGDHRDLSLIEGEMKKKKKSAAGI